MLGELGSREFKRCDYGHLVNVSTKFRLERKRSDRKTRLRYKTGDWDVTRREKAEYLEFDVKMS